jgi:hypothetical protein
MNVVFGRSLKCITIAKMKCSDSEKRETCEAIEYIKCFR